MKVTYDTIGQGYKATRAADPRITQRLVELLDLPATSSILDIGAGTGNYSSALAESGFKVTALEPSEVMRLQGKNHERLEWTEGSAESLPFEGNSFDGAVMTLCIHHFSNWRDGLKEAARVVGDGPLVILTFDAHSESNFWLFDYFPAFLRKDKEWFPKISDLSDFSTKHLSKMIESFSFPLPPDLIDHFASAGWARPEIYLNEAYRSGISSFASVDPQEVDCGIENLKADLESGAWERRYGSIREYETLDTGYIFVKISKVEPVGAGQRR